MPHQEIEQCRDGERECPEQIGGSTTARIGDDSCRHFEDHHPGGEKRVRGKRFRIA
jgi:hypothetical protein